MVRVLDQSQVEMFSQLDLNIVIDIDGTLSDDSWRDGFMISQEDDPAKRDWDKYHSEAKHDMPIDAILELQRSFYKRGFGIIPMRPAVTEKWRQRNHYWIGQKYWISFQPSY